MRAIVMRWLVLPLLLLASGGPAVAARPAAGLVRVVLDTGIGPIVVAVDTRHAPITARNFLAYVDQHRFDGSSFYRAARSKTHPGEGLVQGGIDHFMPKALAPIAHEPTSKTGLRHVDGTISMARNAPGTAMGDFFVTVGPASNLDAAPNYPGYAAFGHVVSGMPLIRRMLDAPTYPGGYSYDTIGQSIIHKIPIVSARRVP
jgi:peptidyl-prolyl cis-trans isomerase A (cyclophilin A)